MSPIAQACLAGALVVAANAVAANAASAQDLPVFPGAEPKTPSGDELVRVTLLADRDTIEPGETFVLGVRLEIERGWHVYWTNPGEGGLPTTASVTAPAGVTLEPAIFPGPHLFLQPGDIVNYGYEEETLVWFEATAAKTLAPGTRLRFEAEAEWLVCDEICLPGGGSDTLELPVSAEPASGAKPAANAELFARYRASLPRAIDELEHLELSWSGTDEDPVLDIRVAGAHELEFFPDATPQGVRLTAASTNAIPGGRSVRLSYRIRKAPAGMELRAAGLLRVVGSAPTFAERERFYRIDHAWGEASQVPGSGPR